MLHGVGLFLSIIDGQSLGEVALLRDRYCFPERFPAFVADAPADTPSGMPEALALAGVRNTVAAILDQTPAERRSGLDWGADKDYINFGYRGPSAEAEVERGEFEYVRFREWYETHNAATGEMARYEPHEVRLVGRSYARWLDRFGMARIIGFDEAKAESDYQRRYVRGLWRDEGAPDACGVAAELIAEGRTDAARPVVEAMEDAEADRLLADGDWSGLLDYLGGVVPGSPALASMPDVTVCNFGSLLVGQWAAGPVCLGGPLHDSIPSTAFTCLPPAGYAETDFWNDATPIARVLTHDSLADPVLRVETFNRWYLGEGATWLSRN